jgi:hypothetical protein
VWIDLASPMLPKSRLSRRPGLVFQQGRAQRIEFEPTAVSRDGALYEHAADLRAQSDLPVSTPSASCYPPVAATTAPGSELTVFTGFI